MTEEKTSLGQNEDIKILDQICKCSMTKKLEVLEGKIGFGGSKGLKISRREPVNQL